MIADHLARAVRYEGLHPLFARAFDFLKRPDLPELPDGKWVCAAISLIISV